MRCDPSEESRSLLSRPGSEALSTKRRRARVVHSKHLEDEGLEADVGFDCDIYDAVVVSAFGGVKVNLARNASMLVHPLWIFILCVPLWVMQLSALTFLRLGQDVEQTVHQRSEDEPWHLRGNMLLTMKLMLIIILQFSLFKEVLGAIQLLCFVVNPTTWTDIKRPNPRKMRSFGGFMFYSSFTAPFTVGAMVMKTCVAYIVCVDSISIILGSVTEKQVIFDSLVITFLKDLDEVWWNVCAMIFHFDDFDSFVFRTASHDFVLAARDSVFWPGMHKRCACLRRVNFGRKIEGLLSFTIAFLFYTRQCIVILYAFDTNVLPLARDVCTLWRWEAHKERWFHTVAALYRTLKEYLLVMDIRQELLNGSLDEICSSDKYDRMRTEDIARMMYKYQRECTCIMVILLLIFFAPQLIYHINGYLSSVDLAKNLIGEENDDTFSIKKQLEKLRNDVDYLLGKPVASRASSRSSCRMRVVASSVESVEQTETKIKS